jgi:hypothetical protein
VQRPVQRFSKSGGLLRCFAGSFESCVAHSSFSNLLPEFCTRNRGAPRQNVKTLNIGACFQRADLESLSETQSSGALFFEFCSKGARSGRAGGWGFVKCESIQSPAPSPLSSLRCGKVTLTPILIQREVAVQSAKPHEVAIGRVNGCLMRHGDRRNLGVAHKISTCRTSVLEKLNHVRNMVRTFMQNTNNVALEP